MYRVELKDISGTGIRVFPKQVPNVPCGVESFYLYIVHGVPPLFLMYRVELKVRP